MPPLQDSVLRLYDAMKTRLEVSFHFFFFNILIFFILIMNLVLLVHKAFIQAQFGLLSSNAVYYNFAIQGIFLLLYHMEDTPFFWTLGLHFHGPDHMQAHLSFVR